MSGKAIAGTLLVLALLVVVALGVGVPAYQYGVAQGMADTGKIVAPVAGAPYMYGPFFPYGRFGWGFGPLGCLFPLLGFFIVFGLLRMLFWGRPRMWRHGYWSGEAPPVFSEWHRRAHGEPPAEPQTKTNG